jgi:hypothetical protein
MALLAVGLRIALFAIASGIVGTGFTDYARAADGYQYIAYARAWLGDGAELAARPHYGRFFPGYPMLLAALQALGLPVAAASLLPSWLAAGGGAVLGALCFRDRRVGWALAALTPSYVFGGSLISSETLCLFFSLVGLLASRRGSGITAGIAFGLGGLFRPVAVFAMAGAVAAELLERRLRRATTVTALAGLTVAAGLAAVYLRFGDALMNVRLYMLPPPLGYGGELLTWPFRSLIETPLETPVAAWKVAYVAVHLLAVLAGTALAVRQAWRAAPEDRPLAAAAAVWLGTNTLYVLSIGGVWGFHDFPRFMVPALPPLFWAFRRLLPSRPWPWLAVGALSVALALPPAVRRLRELPPATPAPAETRGG